MDLDEIRKYCLMKPGSSESFPFDDETLVFKVADRMFCLCNLNPPFSINLKCDPEKAIELREEFQEIIPGYHMNKKHWNTINLEGNLSNAFINQLIDDSYNLVFNKLTNKQKESLSVTRN